MAEEHTIRDKNGKLRNVKVTPGRAIRLHCIECVDSYKDVKDCGGDKLLSGGQCPLYPYRLGKGRPSVKVIRKECIACMNGQFSLIPDCPSKYCALYPFRMGKVPSRAGRFMRKKHSVAGLENS
jgi:hypothetical protein